MKVSVKFSCPEVLGNLKSGVYDVASGTSVRDLLTVCGTECNFQVDEKHLKWLLVVVNGRQVNWHTALSENSEVLFLRGALGG